MNKKLNSLSSFLCREGGKILAFLRFGEGFVDFSCCIYPLIRQGFKSLAHRSSPLKRTQCFLYKDLQSTLVDLSY